MWKIRSIKVIPVVVEALGSTSSKLKKYIEELGVVISTVLLQKTRESSCIKEGFRLRIQLVEPRWDLIKKDAKCRRKETVPKTEQQVRKNVKVEESTGF